MPHGGCYQGDKGPDCSTSTGKVPDPAAKVSEEVKSPNPKLEEVKEAIKDFFAPIIEGFSGGQKPAESPTTAKVDVEKTLEKVNSVKGVQTPVHDPEFLTKLNGCIDEVENVLIQEVGSKTTDPDAPTDEDKKDAAEQDLANGFCDSGYYGWEFCNQWKFDQDSTPASTENEEKDEYDRAMEEFHRTGTCDRRVLGEAFCAAAEYALAITPVEDKAPEDPKSDENPPNTVPHISTDGAPVNGNPNPENPKTND